MRAEKPTIDIIQGTSGILVGLGVLVLALFPLAIPLIALTAVALVPFLVPVLAAALVGAVLVSPLLLARRLRRRSRDTAPRTVDVRGRWKGRDMDATYLRA
jgi:membrane protein implicated in regulation of membrane protease activity